MSAQHHRTKKPGRLTRLFPCLFPIRPPRRLSSMLLEITTTAPPPTNSGFLLHKNPASVFEKTLSFGVVRSLHRRPLAGHGRWACRAGAHGLALAPCVSDRPYDASSFFAVALDQAFSTVLSGHAKDRAERLDELWPLVLRLPVVDCDGGVGLIRDLFEPFGYAVEAARLPLDPRFPEWVESSLYQIALTPRRRSLRGRRTAAGARRGWRLAWRSGRRGAKAAGNGVDT